MEKIWNQKPGTFGIDGVIESSMSRVGRSQLSFLKLAPSASRPIRNHHLTQHSLHGRGTNRIARLIYFALKGFGNLKCGIGTTSFPDSQWSPPPPGLLESLQRRHVRLQDKRPSLLNQLSHRAPRQAAHPSTCYSQLCPYFSTPTAGSQRDPTQPPVRGSVLPGPRNISVIWLGLTDVPVTSPCLGYGRSKKTIYQLSSMRQKIPQSLNEEKEIIERRIQSIIFKWDSGPITLN